MDPDPPNDRAPHGEIDTAQHRPSRTGGGCVLLSQLCSGAGDA